MSFRAYARNLSILLPRFFLPSVVRMTKLGFVIGEFCSLYLCYFTARNYLKQCLIQSPSHSFLAKQPH